MLGVVLSLFGVQPPSGMLPCFYISLFLTLQAVAGVCDAFRNHFNAYSLQAAAGVCDVMIAKVLTALIQQIFRCHILL